MFLARDIDGMISLFVEEPFLSSRGAWYADRNPQSILLKPHQYPEVTFENSPVEVELELKLAESEEPEPQESWHEHCAEIGKLCREVLGKE